MFELKKKKKVINEVVKNNTFHSQLGMFDLKEDIFKSFTYETKLQKCPFKTLDWLHIQVVNKMYNRMNKNVYNLNFHI